MHPSCVRGTQSSEHGAGSTARNDPDVGSVTALRLQLRQRDANSANCMERRFERGSLGAAGARGALQRGTLGCGAGRWPRLPRRRPLRHVLHWGRGARALEARAAAGHAVVEARGGRARRDRRRAARHGGGEEATRALRVERAEARGVLEVAPGLPQYAAASGCYNLACVDAQWRPTSLWCGTLLCMAIGPRKSVSA